MAHSSGPIEPLVIWAVYAINLMAQFLLEIKPLNKLSYTM